MKNSLPKFKATALELKTIGEAFSATPERIRIAARRAVAYAARWANSQILHELPGITGVSGKIINGRVRVDITESSGRVWVGLSKVGAHRLGPVQSSSGVLAAGFAFPDAFIVSGEGNLSGKVFARTGIRRIMKNGTYTGKMREAIKKQEVGIYDRAEIQIRQVAEEIHARFFKEFKNQLRWMSN